MFRDFLLIAATFAGGTLLASPAPGDADKAAGPEGMEFFEARVRPVLVENCLECHGEKSQKGGLRLDSMEGTLRGAEEGPVIVAGHPDQSPMIRALRHEGEIKMPPRGKLPEEAIEALTAWVRMGAPWPDAGTGEAAVAEVRPPEQHWAFRPVQDPAPPATGDAWAASPIDAFVLAKLSERGMHPAPEADRRALIRRVSFDLTGLPPTPAEVQAFTEDLAPDSYEKLVDRLLASPRYGERWGRHWLDVARYSDTKGYVFEEERRFPYSYTYRDWVIRAFNEGLPYDRFIIEQLAADLLPAGTDRRSLAAMGFLTLGRRFLNNESDIIDDRIDVTMRGLMALTVSCARCHDHKYDPIPTADYYSLYGVFASAVEPKDLPLIAEPEATDAYRAYEKEVGDREAEVTKVLEEKHKETVARFRKTAGEYLVRIARQPEPSPEERRERGGGNVAAGDLHPFAVRRWREYLKTKSAEHHRVWAPWSALVAVPAAELPAKAGCVLDALLADKEKPLNELVAKSFGGEAPKSMEDVARRYGEVLGKAQAEWDAAIEARKKANEPAPTALADAALEEIRAALHAEDAPPSFPLAEIERFLQRDARQQIRQLRKKVEEFKVTAPGAPARAMSLEDAAKPREPRIFTRGNPQNPGKAVPRQFLAALSGPERKPFQEGSGRLELARAIASPANPLTARVFVNRSWIHLFGAGLVRTPADFGARSEAPTHPELLDWLAARFIEDGWSMKKLHRRILLSRTYRQSSEGEPEYESTDPANMLLWRANRRRLDFEALRDAMLDVSGSLDLAMGGKSRDLLEAPYRRTVYAYIDRQNLPGVFRAFDFASPDTSTAQRYVTTVPQQALFLMNSPFALGLAERLASRPETASAEPPERRIEALYRLVFGRAPDPEEVTAGLRYVETGGASPEEGWTRYAHALMLSNEFVFID